MKSRILGSVMILLYTTACHGTEPHASVAPITMTLCSLAERGLKEPAHELIHLKAEYVTDLRHGAFFVDPRCPKSTLQRGPDGESASSSVTRFDNDVTGDILNHDERRFVVDMLGRIIDEDQKRCFNAIFGRSRKCFFVPEKVIGYQRITKKKVSGTNNPLP